MKFFKLDETLDENDDNIRMGKKNISRIVLIITYCTIIGVIIASIYELKTQRYENNIIGWIIGAFFVVIAVPLTIYDIIMHISNYYKPDLQMHCVRILFMVPVYSFNSWLALLFSAKKVYWETLRESYEAYVLYSYFHLMLNYLGTLDLPNKTFTHLFPFKCIIAPINGTNFVKQISIGVLQYLIIRMLVTFIGLIIYMIDPVLYGYEDFGSKNAYSVFMAIIALSQAYAVYCIVLFCKRMHDELVGIHPVSKFLIIKFIIFLTFWQNVIIPLCNYIEAVQYVLIYSQDTDGIKNLLICIEMAFAAIGHHVYYNYTQFGNASEDIQTKKTKMYAIVQIIMPFDIINNIIQMFQKKKPVIEQTPCTVCQRTNCICDSPDFAHV